jgi:hypothetical protein
VKLELTEDGFNALNAKIDELQDKATAGIVDPSRAASLLRDVRLDLFSLAQLMKAKVVIVKDEVSTGATGPAKIGTESTLEGA